MILEVEFCEKTKEIELEFCDTTKKIELDFEELQTITVGAAEKYEGPHEITPAREEQILHTKEKNVEQDITIKAIPKEYGLVTYNQDKVLRIE